MSSETKFYNIYNDLTRLANSAGNVRINQYSYIKQLPDEVVLRVFEFLRASDLSRASCVCRDWKVLAADDTLLNLTSLFPNLKIIDKTTWQAHIDLEAFGLSVDDEPIFDKRELIPELEKLSRQVEGDAGVTLLTMPKGLTFNKLVKFAGCPKKGNRTRFEYVREDISLELRDTPVGKTEIVAISNCVLRGSRNKTTGEQQKLVEQLAAEMPRILDVATLAILTHIISTAVPPTRLYGDNPRTYTRCLEQINGNNLVVGNFGSSGVFIDFSHAEFVKDFGVAALRKF